MSLLRNGAGKSARTHQSQCLTGCALAWTGRQIIRDSSTHLQLVLLEVSGSLEATLLAIRTSFQGTLILPHVSGLLVSIFHTI